MYLTHAAIANASDVPSKPDALESVRFIQEQVDYINKIVSDLQDYARPIKPLLMAVNVETLVKTSLASLAVPRNIKTAARFEAALPEIRTDPVLLKRILTNLATNAFKRCPTAEH